MPKRLSQKELEKRLSQPIRDTFTDFGCIALESVIKGRITHSEADQALMMLKDCILDKGGDLMSPDRLRMYMKRIKAPSESIDLTYYTDANYI